jgi:hypothetical protein
MAFDCSHELCFFGVLYQYESMQIIKDTSQSRHILVNEELTCILKVIERLVGCAH